MMIEDDKNMYANESEVLLDEVCVQISLEQLEFYRKFTICLEGIKISKTIFMAISETLN